MPKAVEIHFTEDCQRRIKLDGKPFHGPSTCSLPLDYQGIAFPAVPPKILAQVRGGSYRRATSRKAQLPPEEIEVVRVFQETTLREMGACLYRELIPPELQGVIRANFGGEGLHLSFDVTEAEALDSEPFEAMYTSKEDGAFFLSTNGKTCIWRYIAPSGEGLNRQPLAEKARALFVGAAPDQDIDYDAEIARLTQQTIAGQERTLRDHDGGQAAIKWEFETHVSYDRLETLLREHWDIVHFACHGGFDETKLPFLRLHDSLNPALKRDVRADRVRNLLQNSAVTLITLNACESGKSEVTDVFSGMARTLVLNRVPFVVAMRDSISDAAAIRFSEAFYRALSSLNKEAIPPRYHSVPEAVTLGRAAILTADLPEFQTIEFPIPVLYSSLRDPEIRAFLPPPPAIGEEEASRGGVWGWFGRNHNQVVIVLMAVGMAGTAIGFFADRYFGEIEMKPRGMTDSASEPSDGPSDGDAATGDAEDAADGSDGVDGSDDYSEYGTSYDFLVACEDGSPNRGDGCRDRPDWMIDWDRSDADPPHGDTSGDPDPPYVDPRGWLDPNLTPPGLPPRPLPPPPLPPAPVAAPCNPGPYIVFFDWNRSDITPEAATILNNAMSAFGNCGAAAISLGGHTDRSGSNEHNIGLAERRNTGVRNYLLLRGIPAVRISSQAFGETAPRVPTADGVREMQNNRVEITFGPPAPGSDAAVYLQYERARSRLGDSLSQLERARRSDSGNAVHPLVDDDSVARLLETESRLARLERERLEDDPAGYLAASARMNSAIGPIDALTLRYREAIEQRTIALRRDFQRIVDAMHEDGRLYLEITAPYSHPDSEMDALCAGFGLRDRLLGEIRSDLYGFDQTHRPVDTAEACKDALRLDPSEQPEPSVPDIFAQPIMPDRIAVVTQRRRFGGAAYNGVPLGARTEIRLRLRGMERLALDRQAEAATPAALAGTDQLARWYAAAREDYAARPPGEHEPFEVVLEIPIDPAAPEDQELVTARSLHGALVERLAHGSGGPVPMLMAACAAPWSELPGEDEPRLRDTISVSLLPAGVEFFLDRCMSIDGDDDPADED